MAKDYYVILGLGSSARPEDVRAAYRRRALELHPDRSGGGSAPFQDLQEAYAVLIDPERRTAYDRLREGTLGRSRSRAEPLRAGAARAEPFLGGERRWRRGVEPIRIWEDFETYEPGLEELTDRWWLNFGLGAAPKGETIRGLTVEVPILAEDARWGGEVEIRVPVRAVCRRCGGRGGVGPFECGVCGGAGIGFYEHPLRVGYPAGLVGDHEVEIGLEHLGVNNLYVRVRFRVAG